MAFRSKSPERAYEEIMFLCQKHGIHKVGCVDNILDMHYIDTLFPRLAASGLNLDMFYEVKANLRYDQLVKMHRGGLRQIQPGIESFSNEVLRLMNKGVTGFQNIQLMRWCEEIGIGCDWNLLAGFPDESPSEYEKMAELIPKLTHLNPPCSCAEIRLDRFSPFHSRAASFGFQKMRPARAYYYVFPLGHREMNRLAYFFDFDYADGRKPAEYLEPVRLAVNRWWERSYSGDRAVLDAHFDGGIVVTDTRDIATAPRHNLTGLRAEIFSHCDIATPFPALVRRLELEGREQEAREALDSLIADHLIAAGDGQYLSLAVFRNRPAHLLNQQQNAYRPISQAAAAQPLLRLV
jgi:ribosomal peptide maturation radical SAM protein 1